MNSRSGSLLFLLGFGLAIISVCGLKFDEEVQEFFIKISNTLRKIPDTANMEQVSWDREVAENASRSAEECNRQSDYGRDLPHGVTTYLLRSNVGNLLVPLLSWYSKGYFYDFKKNNCTYKELCRPFTHVMRHDTVKVGCGYGLCDIGEAAKRAFVVCIYKNGIFKVGEALYTEGEYCSGCPSNLQCNNQLCSLPDEPKHSGEINYYDERF